jgi:hypothetical protein
MVIHQRMIKFFDNAFAKVFGRFLIMGNADIEKMQPAQLGFSGRLIAKKLSLDGSGAIRDCRTTHEFANADYSPNEKLAFSNKGRSHPNEQGHLSVTAAFKEKLNLLSGK